MELREDGGSCFARARTQQLLRRNTRLRPKTLRRPVRDAPPVPLSGQVEGLDPPCKDLLLGDPRRLERRCTTPVLRPACRPPFHCPNPAAGAGLPREPAIVQTGHATRPPRRVAEEARMGAVGAVEIVSGGYGCVEGGTLRAVAGGLFEAAFEVARPGTFRGTSGAITDVRITVPGSGYLTAPVLQIHSGGRGARRPRPRPLPALSRCLDAGRAGGAQLLTRGGKAASEKKHLQSSENRPRGAAGCTGYDFAASLSTQELHRVPVFPGVGMDVEIIVHDHPLDVVDTIQITDALPEVNPRQTARIRGPSAPIARPHRAHLCPRDSLVRRRRGQSMALAVFHPPVRGSGFLRPPSSSFPPRILLQTHISRSESERIPAHICINK